MSLNINSRLEDWQQQLRKQSAKRSSSDDNIMGTEDAPVDFKSLTMTEKLEVFYRVCEWHFHNPNSLRSRMRDDDEYANWVRDLYFLVLSLLFYLLDFSAYTAHCFWRER